MICRSGSGCRGDPFVYWLPSHEALLWPGNGSHLPRQPIRDR
jgi:hypothetical protein